MMKLIRLNTKKYLARKHNIPEKHKTFEKIAVLNYALHQEIECLYNIESLNNYRLFQLLNFIKRFVFVKRLTQKQ